MADGTIKRLILGKTGVSCANGTVGLLPAFAHARFAGTGMATGLMLAARGLGALLGPLLARAVAGSAPTRRAIVIVCGESSWSSGAQRRMQLWRTSQINFMTSDAGSG